MKATRLSGARAVALDEHCVSETAGGAGGYDGEVRVGRVRRGLVREQAVGGRREQPHARRAERVPDRQRAAPRVHTLERRRAERARRAHLVAREPLALERLGAREHHSLRWATRSTSTGPCKSFTTLLPNCNFRNVTTSPFL